MFLPRKAIRDLRRGVGIALASGRSSARIILMTPMGLSMVEILNRVWWRYSTGFLRGDWLESVRTDLITGHLPSSVYGLDKLA